MKIVVFVVLLAILTFPGFSQETGDFDVMQNSGGTVIITGYRGAAKDVVIPEAINGIPVTAIGHTAFRNLALTSVTLSETVTFIGELAFADNELTHLVLNEGLAVIGISAFTNNKLTEVTIPNSVTAIRYGAFNKNPITAVSISNKVSAIMPSVFAKTELSQITIGDGTELYIENFEKSFVNYYISQSKRAGTYVKSEGVWVLR